MVNATHPGKRFGTHTGGRVSRAQVKYLREPSRVVAIVVTDTTRFLPDGFS